MHFELQVALNLGLEESAHAFELYIKLGVGCLHLFGHHFSCNLVNIDVFFGEVDSEFASQVVAFCQDTGLGSFHDLLALQHLVFVHHQLLQVLGCQQHEVALESLDLGLVDAGIPSHQVQKLVCLLPSGLFLSLIPLDERGKLGSARCHISLALLLVVVRLGLLLELSDDLVLLSHFEVQLPHLVLQDRVQVVFSVCSCCICLSLLVSL